MAKLKKKLVKMMQKKNKKALEEGEEVVLD
jgi:hypothetical protein